MHEAAATWGAGPADVRIVLGTGCPDVSHGRPGNGLGERPVKLKELLSSGQALTVLRKMVAAQGGDTGLSRHQNGPQCPRAAAIGGGRTGYVLRYARIVGDRAVRLEGPNAKVTKVDHRVGILLHKSWCSSNEVNCWRSTGQPTGGKMRFPLKDACDYCPTAAACRLVRGFVTPDGFSRQLPKEFKV